MLVNEKQLMDWSGIKDRTKLVSWLSSQRIPYLPSIDGRICTTIAAINKPIVGVSNATQNALDFE